MTLGNLGLPVTNLRYHRYRKKPEFFFLRYYRPFLFLQSEQDFYNITKPFTEVGYSTSFEGKEIRQENLELFHTQNLSEPFNLCLHFRSFSSGGFYQSQAVKAYNMRASGNYTKGRYSMHGSFMYNSIGHDENGGILNLQNFRDTEEDAKIYLVHLDDAETNLRDWNFLVSQEYDLLKKRRPRPDTLQADTLLPGSLPPDTIQPSYRSLKFKETSLVHSLHYIGDRKSYLDNIPLSATDRYYRNFFADSTASFDSINFRGIHNSLHLRFLEDSSKKNDFELRLAAGSEWNRYYQMTRVDTTEDHGTTATRLSSRKNYHNLWVGGGLYRRYGRRWNWEINARLYLTGYKQGNTTAFANLKRYLGERKKGNYIGIQGQFALERPDFFVENLISNHFQWNNDFEFTREISGALTYYTGQSELEAGLGLDLVDNFIYFDTLAQPAQYYELLQVTTAWLEKGFNWGIYHNNTRVLFQLSTAPDILSLPLIAAYHHSFIEVPVVREVLTTRLGFDVYYHTKYKGYGFMPAIGQFYLNNREELGGYPFINVYLSARLKRARIFVKYDHLNSGFPDKNYFLTYKYPLYPRSVRFGFRWTFYN